MAFLISVDKTPKKKKRKKPVRLEVQKFPPEKWDCSCAISKNIRFPLPFSETELRRRKSIVVVVVVTVTFRAVSANRRRRRCCCCLWSLCSPSGKRKTRNALPAGNVRCSQTASLVFSVFERSALCLLHRFIRSARRLPPVLQTRPQTQFQLNPSPSSCR